MARKRIVICTTHIPFTTGGAELLTEALRRNLSQRDHLVEVVALPFSFGPKEATVLSSLAWRMIEVKEITGAPPDVVIPLKFPAYLVNHDNKIVWLCHQHRAAYDLFNTPFSDYKDDEEGRYYRDIIKRMDTVGLGGAKKIFTISANVSERLRRFNNLQSEPLLIPPVLERPLRPGNYRDYILYVGRLTGLKRVDLLIRSLAHTDHSIKAVIVGTGDQEDQHKQLAKELKVANRIKFTGFVPDDELIDIYADARAVFFTPVDEDYGMIVVEAYRARKPVITCNDSGGVLELVRDGVTGYVCEPTPEALAEKINILYRDQVLAEQLGRAGEESAKDITWDNVISKLEESF